MVLEKERFYCQDQLKACDKIDSLVETFSMGNIHILTLGAVWINMDNSPQSTER